MKPFRQSKAFSCPSKRALRNRSWSQRKAAPWKWKWELCPTHACAEHRKVCAWAVPATAFPQPAPQPRLQYWWGGGVWIPCPRSRISSLTNGSLLLLNPCFSSWAWNFIFLLPLLLLSYLKWLTAKSFSFVNKRIKERGVGLKMTVWSCESQCQISHKPQWKQYQQERALQV